MQDGAGALKTARVNGKRRFGGRAGSFRRIAVFRRLLHADAIDIGGRLLPFRGNIRFISAAQVIGIEPVLHQDAAGNVAAQPDGAVSINRAVLWNFLHAAAQIVKGDIDRTFNGARLRLGNRAHIKQSYFAAVEAVHFIPVERFDVSAQNISRRKTEHIDRVFCR